MLMYLTNQPSVIAILNRVKCVCRDACPIGHVMAKIFVGICVAFFLQYIVTQTREFHIFDGVFLLLNLMPFAASDKIFLPSRKASHRLEGHLS